MNLILADVVVAVHFAWVFYVVIGQLFILLGIALKWGWIRNFWFRYTHLSMMLIVAVETLFWLNCPLTVWEKRLRGFGSEEVLTYAETDSFIARWLGRLLFCEGVDSQVLEGVPIVAGYLAFTALVVWSFWKVPPRLPMSTASFVALIHATIGGALLAPMGNNNLGVGVCFLVQAALWYRLQDR